MKENSRILVGLAIIVIFGLIYGIFFYKEPTTEDNNDSNVNNQTTETVETIVDELNLPYLSIYMTNEGSAYLVPINTEKIDELEEGNNLKERLKTLFNRALELKITKDDQKLKGYEVKLDSKVKKMYIVSFNDKDYVIFHKENNKLGFFDYDSYYNLMYTEVLDNYNNIENVLKIENNDLYYIDGSSVSIDTIIK